MEVFLRAVLNAEYFLQKADECFRLSHAASDIRPELKAIAYEFMTRAAELDIGRGRSQERPRLAEAGSVDGTPA